MVYDIVFVCNSVNNKNVRGNELEILRKVEDQLYFEFGETENNVKKRFYKDLGTLNSDFEKLNQIKEDLEKKATIEEAEEKVSVEGPEEVKEEEKEDVFKKTRYKNGKKKIF